MSKGAPDFSRVEFKEHCLEDLQALFPDNNSAEFSIDSSMQKLRDDGEIEFIKSGCYEWLGFDDGDVEIEPEVVTEVVAEEYSIENIIKDGCFTAIYFR